MPIKYIVLSESNHYGWDGGFTTLAKAKEMLNIETDSLILTHKPYTEKVNQNVVLKKETIKASELRRGDMCIVKNKIYKIIDILFVSTQTTNGLDNKKRFILYCEEDKSKIERIYPHDFQLELDENSYVEIKQ